MKEILEDAARVIGLLTFAVLWLAFIYEYGFFYVVGRPLQSLMTGTDYMTSAVMWLPSSAFFLGLGLLIANLGRRVGGFQLAPWGTRKRLIHELPVLFIVPWVLVVGTSFFLKIRISGPSLGSIRWRTQQAQRILKGIVSNPRQALSVRPVLDVAEDQESGLREVLSRRALTSDAYNTASKAPPRQGKPTRVCAQ